MQTYKRAHACALKTYRRTDTPECAYNPWQGPRLGGVGKHLRKSVIDSPTAEGDAAVPK